MKPTSGMRSRGACHTCKKRRRKCDETRPSCGQCRQTGRLCGGYDTQLRWGSGIASRGRFTGASLPLMAAVPPKEKGRKRELGCQRKALGSGSKENSHGRAEYEDEAQVGTEVLAAVETDSGPHSHTREQQIPCSHADAPTYTLDTDYDGGFEPAMLTMSSPYTHSGGLTLDQPNGQKIQENATANTSSCSPQPVRLLLGAWSSRTAEDQLLFEEFLSSGHRMLYSTKVDESPITALFNELVKNSDALFAACVTIQIYVSEKETPNFYKHNDAALKSFATELSNRSGKLNAGTMAAGLLLCTIGVLQGTPWTMHLECMDKVFSLRWDLDHLLSLPPHINQLMEVMGMMDLPTFVIGRKNPSLMIWSRFRRHQAAFDQHQAEGIEPVTGIPRSLIDLISNIESDCAAADFWLWTGEPGDFIQLHLWEAFRFAGILFANRLQRLKLGPQVDAQLSSAVLLPSPEVLVCRIVACLEAIECYLATHCDGSQFLVANAILYPIIAAGLEVTILRNKPTLKATLSQAFQFHCSYNSHNSETAWELVLEAWELDEDNFDIFEAVRTRGLEIALF